MIRSMKSYELVDLVLIDKHVYRGLNLVTQFCNVIR